MFGQLSEEEEMEDGRLENGCMLLLPARDNGRIMEWEREAAAAGKEKKKKSMETVITQKERIRAAAGKRKWVSQAPKQDNTRVHRYFPQSSRKRTEKKG